jgi:hypothetical protein
MKKVGDPIKRDEPIFEISTDKVDAEIPGADGGHAGRDPGARKARPWRCRPSSPGSRPRPVRWSPRQPRRRRCRHRHRQLQQQLPRRLLRSRPRRPGAGRRAPWRRQRQPRARRTVVPRPSRSAFAVVPRRWCARWPPSTGSISRPLPAAAWRDGSRRMT